MVKITEEQVYDALRYVWEDGRDIQNRIREELGLTRLSLADKIKYLATFQFYDISEPEFFNHVGMLKESNLAETRIRKNYIHGVEVNTCQVRKKPSGTKKDDLKEVEGLELVLSII